MLPPHQGLALGIGIADRTALKLENGGILVQTRAQPAELALPSDHPGRIVRGPQNHLREAHAQRQELVQGRDLVEDGPAQVGLV
jgi:hypothetical protein